MLERRVALLGVLREALERARASTCGSVPRTSARHCGRSSLVAAGYGLPGRKLGTVSVIGPVRMDYGGAIDVVREAAFQLSRFVEDVYSD